MTCVIVGCQCRGTLEAQSDLVCLLTSAMHPAYRNKELLLRKHTDDLARSRAAPWKRTSTNAGETW